MANKANSDLQAGLEGQVTPIQASKKWDNLKTKGKVKQIRWLGSVVG